MIGYVFCVIAFVVTYVLARRRLSDGIASLIGFGFAFGILRANFLSTASYFVFDCALLGLYAARLFQLGDTAAQPNGKAMIAWVGALCGWPLLLMLDPRQDTLVQLFGLRATILMLPLLLLGVRLSDNDMIRLANWVAALCVVAFAVALAEVYYGIDGFFPRNRVTNNIIYKRSVVDDRTGATKFMRIPSLFSSSYYYGNAMVAAIPFIMGSFIRAKGDWRTQPLLIAGGLSSVFGVLLSASRTIALILAGVLLALFFSTTMKVSRRLVLSMLAGGAWLLSSGTERLQNFTTLSDKQQLLWRVAVSVNEEIFEAIAESPWGNGLGTGMLDLPSFIPARVGSYYVAENEVARVSLEQGWFGLLIWTAFVVWLFIGRSFDSRDPWRSGRRLAWMFGAMTFGTAWIGIGVFLSIPSAAMLLLLMGWIAAGSKVEVLARSSEPVLTEQFREVVA